MKRIIFFGMLLIMGILKVNAQCSTNTSYTSNGNGSYAVDFHANYPLGWSFSYSIGYGDDTYDWGNVMDTSFTHQFYANDTFIVFVGLEGYNLLDTNQRCSSYTWDTIIVQDYSCAVEARYLFYNPSNGGTSESSFAAGYYASTSNVICNWYIQDALGNTIYTTSGLNLNNLLYTFTQNGMYTISYAAHANDIMLQTQCSDSIAIVINRNFISSCGAQLNMIPTNMGGNTVMLEGGSNMPYSNSYFYIYGQYFLNTDSIVYNFPSEGWHPICFYTENIDGGITCRDSFCLSIPVGGLPGHCNAAFTLWEDSTNIGQWYAINNSTGFGPPNYLWDFGDGSTSNLAYPTHTYSVPGNYVICLTVSDNYGCSSTMCDSTSGMRISQQQAINSQMGSLTVLAPQVGISENKITIDRMKLFPNPMLEITTVEFNSTLGSNARIEIVNILGSVVSTEDVFISKGNNELKLNTSALESGIYIINVISESGVIARVKALK